jgi:hypothetical protein
MQLKICSQVFYGKEKQMMQSASQLLLHKPLKSKLMICFLYENRNKVFVKGAPRMEDNNSTEEMVLELLDVHIDSVTIL